MSIHLILIHKVFIRRALKYPLAYFMSKKSCPLSIYTKPLFRNGQDLFDTYQDYRCREFGAPIYRDGRSSVLKYNMIQQIARIGYKYLFIILESKPNSNTGNKTYPFINSTEKERRTIYATFLIFHIKRTNCP